MNALVGGIVLLLCTIGQVAANQVFDATRSGDAAAVDRLLNSGAAVDEPGRNGETPLIIAALNDRQDIAALLLAHGADVQARNAGGFTPLHAAAYSGSSVASLLLPKGGARGYQQQGAREPAHGRGRRGSRRGGRAVHRPWRRPEHAGQGRLQPTFQAWKRSTSMSCGCSSGMGPPASPSRFWAAMPITSNAWRPANEGSADDV